MSLSPEEVRFCLRCGARLVRQARFGAVRPVCLDCGYVHFFDPKVAVAVLVEREERVLMVRRAVNPRRGFWTLPGGYMDAGEAPDEAARRECLEETGLDVQITGMLDLITPSGNRQGPAFVIFYHGEVVGGELRAGDDAAEVVWFGREALPELAFESTGVMLGRLGYVVRPVSD